MTARSLLFLGAMAVGCGPSVLPDEGGGTGSGTETTTMATESGTSATSVSATTAVSGGSDSSTGAPPPTDMCADFSVEECPPDCVVAEARRVTDKACNTQEVSICSARGSEHSGPTTTYFLSTADGPLFITAGGICGEAMSPGDGWVECAGLLTHPEECRCFCEQGYCAGSEEVRMLDACVPANACGVLLVDPEFGAVSHDIERCVLEGLRDRVDGVYDVLTGNGFASDTTRLYVYNGVVARILAQHSDILICPERSDWLPGESCELAPAEFFSSCMEAPIPDPECIHQVENWVTNCGGAPAPCFE